MHGNVEGLARVATLVERIAAEADGPVVYVDAGDVEESTTRISNVTKGAAMHRLLSAAGCRAAAVGNAAWLRYGPQVLPDHAAEASYPLLLANVRSPDGSLLPGTQEAALVDCGGVRLGLVGVTAPLVELGEPETFGVSHADEEEAVRRLAASLRERGADHVVLLSHLGFDVPRGVVDDRRLAPRLEGVVDAVVGAHSHDLLPEGERIGGVLVAQAGSFASHLGRIELGGDGVRAGVLEVTEDVPPHPDVLAAVATVEPEVEATLAEVVGELPGPLDQEAGARWLAELLRQRLDADVAIVAPGQAFTTPLSGGVVTRDALWSACDSTANPGVVPMRGDRLAAVLERGRDPELARTTDHALRGRPRGILQVSGDGSLDPEREYLVAGTDWELEPYGGLVEEDWGLRPRYEFPTIVREVIEEHLAAAGR